MPEAVISNTSPLQYLYQVGQLPLLAHFYQQVTIPPAVVQELAAGAAAVQSGRGGGRVRVLGVTCRSRWEQYH